MNAAVIADSMATGERKNKADLDWNQNIRAWVVAADANGADKVVCTPDASVDTDDKINRCGRRHRLEFPALQ